MSAAQRAMIHTQVEMELITDRGETEALTVRLADARSADLDAGWLDIDTPMGRAIRGQPEGARIAYAMGDIVALRILSVTPLDDIPAADAEARRQAILDDARRKSEKTTQEIFSSTYGSKWGAYHAEDLADAPIADDLNRDKTLPPQQD